MQLGFSMPHLLRLKATCQPWEAAVTGADQTRLARWAEKQAEFDLLGIPFHERGARCEEYVQAIIELWTQDKPRFAGNISTTRSGSRKRSCRP